jgi:hypothetical protein
MTVAVCFGSIALFEDLIESGRQFSIRQAHESRMLCAAARAQTGQLLMELEHMFLHAVRFSFFFENIVLFALAYARRA